MATGAGVTRPAMPGPRGPLSPTPRARNRYHPTRTGIQSGDRWYGPVYDGCGALTRLIRPLPALCPLHTVNRTYQAIDAVVAALCPLDVPRTPDASWMRSPNERRRDPATRALAQTGAICDGSEEAAWLAGGIAAAPGSAVSRPMAALTSAPTVFISSAK